MALDESRDEDAIFDVEGLTYVIEKGLFERINPVKVDYVESPMGSGFSISSAMQRPDSCGSCSCAC